MATTSPLDPMVEPTDPQVLHPASQVEPTPDHRSNVIHVHYVDNVSKTWSSNMYKHFIIF